MTKLDITRDLVARGLHLTWIDAGQKALMRDGWQNDRPGDPEKLWRDGSRLNVAVLTGAPSGVFVLDIDTKPGAGGAESMRDLTAQHGRMPETFVVRTPSGGFHYYYRMPSFEVRNSAGSIKDGKVVGLAPGVDIRGTGGYVVGPGSWTAANPSRKTYEGWYQVWAPNPIAEAPQWLIDWLWGEHQRKTRVATNAEHVAGTELAPNQEAWVKSALAGVISDLDALPRPWRPGAGWDESIMRAARRLVELQNDAPHLVDGWQVLLDHAPADEAWDERATKWEHALDYIGTQGSGRKMPEPKADVNLFAGVPMPGQQVQGGGQSWGEVTAAPRRQTVAGEVDVTTPATALDWMREHLGRAATSGVFRRGGDVVFTPKIGQDGYITPRVGEPEGSASISVLDKHALAARITGRVRVFMMKQGKKDVWSEVPAVFPDAVAQHAVKAPDDFHGLRELHGVVHTPTFRPDGSIVSTPGYDEGTGLLLLPTGGQPSQIPDQPTAEDAIQARKIIDYMLQDYRFVSEDYRANYIGLMLTPLLRTLTPFPYKLGVIEAHQPGSGKTFLARALISIHSGVMHAELPADESELGKVVSALLDVTTGGVVVFDNVTGVVRSPTLAGLLTSPTFQGRRLGTGTVVDAVNDRLWVITGNNAALGGDLERRSLPVKLDPGVPNPEQRTDFAIADFERWVREQRGDLLWALITMIRRWVTVGSPMPDKIRADSYGKWAAVVGSILAVNGVPGRFDHPDNVQTNDPEQDEWVSFLETIYAHLGTAPWTTKSLLAMVAPAGGSLGGFPATSHQPIPFDALPGSLVEGKQLVAPATLARALGKHLRNRNGRWFGRLAVRAHGAETRNGLMWQIQAADSAQ